MNDDQQQILDSVLSEWHSWSQNQPITRGHASHSAGMEGYRCSRQHDDQNGALDGDLHHMRCKQVDFEVQQMADPHRAAVYVIARNASTGRAVWASPRLPVEPVARDVVLTEARGIIRRRLLASGIL